jgi:hypothetical protein
MKNWRGTGKSNYDKIVKLDFFFAYWLGFGMIVAYLL